MTLEARAPASGAGPAPAELVDALRALESWGSLRDWAGSDPYDGLNARRLVTPLKHSRRGRQLLTQLVKRSPADLRPLFGIPSEQSSAAIALVISAYARNGFLPEDEASAKLDRALQLLESLRCKGIEEPCWGYHFDVQTRVFFYSRGAPNTIATSFAGRALLDAYDVTKDGALLRRAEAVGDFFLRHVPQTPSEPGAFFGYLIGDRTPIHNANMLVSALLARLSTRTGREDFARAADAGVAYTLAHQRPDGSWPYGERPQLRWVDNFHTGYVLEALMTCLEAGVPSAEQDALERGLALYRNALFLEDGTPRYTTTSTYPVDIQCVAQAIQTFALAEGHEDQAWRVFGYAMRRMRRPDGSFAFQRRRLWVNRTPHVRWAEAPMLLALTHLLRP